MKLMKNKLAMVVVVGIWSSTLFFVQAAKDESISDLEPVLYEKLKFKKNTDYLHDVKKTEMKNTIPEKQFDIYFDGRQKLPNRNDSSYLFQTNVRGEKSTVAAKSVELKLFSNEGRGSEKMEGMSVNDEKQTTNTMRTIILLSFLVFAVVIMFVLLLPKLVQSNNTSAKRLTHKV